MKILNHPLFGAVFVGIVTITIAIATMFAGLHDSKATSHYNQSLVGLNNANTSYLEHIQGGIDETELKQVEEEIEQEGAKFEKNLFLAEFSNTAQDKFLLGVTLLSIVLFLSSTSLSLEKTVTRKILIYLSLTLYLMTIIFMFTLPLPF
jgi:hypothetical protein